MKKVWKETLGDYHRAMVKYQSGTGGRSGAPENYCDWESRPDETFQNYDGLPSWNYLAWIFMKDREIGMLFDAKHEKPPGATYVEDGLSSIATGSIVSKKRKTDDKTNNQNESEIGKYLTATLESHRTEQKELVSTLIAFMNKTNTKK